MSIDGTGRKALGDAWAARSAVLDAEPLGFPMEKAFAAFRPYGFRPLANPLDAGIALATNHPTPWEAWQTANYAVVISPDPHSPSPFLFTDREWD